ncbi:hypothetical protein DV515_00007845 [Chloebia gouldiae]|uniref:Uncharacterized protein n=1 Tax=Chloebia gouldiae TaxID=44316 RepID=A0A3L8SH28_CHLGU|nr:hypothetical protein DV515_00007845 [Chloebia gouldiae]
MQCIVLVLRKGPSFAQLLPCIGQGHPVCQDVPCDAASCLIHHPSPRIPAEKPPGGGGRREAESSRHLLEFGDCSVPVQVEMSSVAPQLEGSSEFSLRCRDIKAHMVSKVKQALPTGGGSSVTEAEPCNALSAQLKHCSEMRHEMESRDSWRH